MNIPATVDAFAKPIADARHAAPSHLATQYLQTEISARNLYGRLVAIGDAGRRLIGQDITDVSRALAAVPFDLEECERQIDACEAAARRAVNALAKVAPPPPAPHAVELLADFGRNVDGLAKSAIARAVDRELERLALRADKFLEPIVIALRGIAYRDPTPLDRLARHAIAELVPMRLDGGGAFGPPPLELGVWTPPPRPSNARPDGLLLRVADACGVVFAPAPSPRANERGEAEREHATATRFGGNEAADKELERRFAASLELERQDHARWSADVNVEIKRCDAALAAAVARENIPTIARVAGDQVRRALRGMPTIRGLDVDLALDVVLEHVALVASDVASAPARELIHLTVTTKRGIKSRSRDGRRYTEQPQAVEVAADEADRLRADDGLIVREAGAPIPSDDDEHAKRNGVEAEHARLIAERDRLRAELARTGDATADDGRPRRLGRSKPQAPASKATDGGDFGGGPQ